MQGQANHFIRYCLSSEPEQYSKDRYVNETRRLYRTLDKHLEESKSKYLVGDKCTIADISISSWTKVLGKLSFRGEKHYHVSIADNAHD
jgi:glutathione S-transferase